MKMSISSNPSRRTFIGFGIAATAGAALRIPAAPADKLQVGIIGSGGRGGANLGGVGAQKDQVRIAALCDTNRQILDKLKAGHPDAKQCSDWREVVADEGIDAVVISTADHHHALAAVAAMQAGKHVYVEKPLAHTVAEARRMQEVYAEQKGKVATQMGTQIHATDNYRCVVELIRAGAIGSVREAHVWCNRSIKAVGEVSLPEQEQPDWLDWQSWLGPAADRPYNQGYWKGGNLNWNRRWEFGNGVLGDMGSHLIDLPWWALGLKRPTSVESAGPEPDPHAAPAWQEVTWEHAVADAGEGGKGPLKVVWYHGPEGMKRRSDLLQPMVGNDTVINKWGIGVSFVGSKGVLTGDYGKHVLSPSTEFKDFQRPEPSIEKSAGHHAEWVKACRGEGSTLCNFEYSGSLIEHNLLGNAAHRLGEKIAWSDQPAWDGPAAKFLAKDYRKGWELG